MPHSVKMYRLEQILFRNCLFDTSHAMMQHPTDVGQVYEVWRSIWGKKNKRTKNNRLLIVCIYVCMYV